MSHPYENLRVQRPTVGERNRGCNQRTRDDDGYGMVHIAPPSQIRLIVSSYFRRVEGRGLWPVGRNDIARRARATCIGNCVGDDRACALVLSLLKNAKLQASKSPATAALDLYLEGAWRQIPSDTVSSKTDC